MRHAWLVLLLLATLVACSSDKDDDSGKDAAVDTLADTVQDVTHEIALDTVAEVALDTVAEVAPEIAADTVEPEDTVPTDTPEEVVEVTLPPTALPFEYTRPAVGEPIPAEEITSFTKAVTGLWKDVDLFRWLLRTSTGVDISTGTDDYLAWHNDISVTKTGDTVRFEQKGGEHNMWINSSTILSQAMNGCMLTGDWTICKVAEQYCKGLTATVKGFVWDEDDPAPYLMARAVFPMDQSFELTEENWKDAGQKKEVIFSTTYEEEDHWNAQTFAWPHNPTWGAMWVTNMRSKDDVRAIVRTSAFLPYIVENAPFDWVQSACQETYDTMQGFNQDIVDSTYFIRTKGPDGVAYSVPDQDLGNYVWYLIIDPTNECSARLSSDLIAYGEPLGFTYEGTEYFNDCGDGTGSVYDAIAPGTHYYNYPIVWDYHMAALGNSLVYGQFDAAFELLGGMTKRMETYMAPDTMEPGADEPQWNRDMAMLLVQAASFGLPLTDAEARQVQQYWLNGVEELSTFTGWDPWDESVPDGPVQVRPSVSSDAIKVQHIALLLEYCASPLKNPAGAQFVDCDIVADPSQWGE